MSCEPQKESKMALFPLISNFEGDFTLLLLPVDSENTIDEVTAAASRLSVGTRVAPQAGRIVRARRSGETAFLPGSLKVSQSGLKPLETIEFVFAAEG
jgi:toluene monooxygenase system protein B